MIASADSHQPLVSIVIPTYNAPRFLQEAVESVDAQTYRRWELIVVDDGSTDDTPEVCRRLSAIDKYIPQSNAGPSEARNTGMRASSGEYIAFLDHDDRWLPSKLERQVEFLTANPEVGLTYTGLRWFDDQDGRIRDTYTPPAEIETHQLISEFFLPNSSIVIHRGVTERVGWWDRDLFISQDRDFHLRISLHYPVQGIPDALTENRHHHSHLSGNPDRWFFEARLLLQRYRGMHGNCARCEQVFTAAQCRIKQILAERLKEQAKEAYRRRRFGAAFALAARSLRHNPSPVTDRLSLSRSGGAMKQ